VTLQEAAALPEVVCTVWSNVFLLAALQPGEVLLVHGGTSGIGTMAVQLAARHGARVLCTVGSPEKARRAEELGAERAIRYRDEDFVEVVREVAGGADVVLDNLGASYLARNVTTLRTGGRLVVIGLQGGAKGELDLGALLTKRPRCTPPACVPGRRRRRRRSWRRCEPRCGRRSRAARCGPSWTACCRWTRSRRRTGCSRRAATSARSCCRWLAEAASCERGRTPCGAPGPVRTCVVRRWRQLSVRPT
jgi:NAD(P)-dependent dehydrogenase (short-subunit alcohol dehydrogenase family)